MGLRLRLMGSSAATKLFDILDIFSNAGITMHFQMVLCKGVNDHFSVMKTVSDLLHQPGAASVAIVPAGITKHRDGLYKLNQFTPQDAGFLIMVAEVMQKANRGGLGVGVGTGSSFAFLSDEWYIMAGVPLPDYEHYEDFPQLDNGVGMIRLFERQFQDEAAKTETNASVITVGIITGQAASGFMCGLASQFKSQHPKVKIKVHVVKNNFFGELITISGLLTGQDVIQQLKGRVTEDVLFLPANAFRAGTEIMLDDTTLAQLSSELGIPVMIGNSDGGEFYKQLMSRLAQT